MMYLQTGGFIDCFSKCVQYNECVTERKEVIIKKVYSLAALREHPIINRINAFLQRILHCSDNVTDSDNRNN